MTQYIAYLRVSTDRQGQSGLGLEAQRATIQGFARGHTIVDEVVEIESGRKNNRPQLDRAIALTKKVKGVLLVARMDRLSRNSYFINKLMESSVEFVACDNPHANKLTIRVLAAVAEYEAERISLNTIAALAAAKARGVKLGGPVAKASRVAQANAKAANAKACEIAQQCYDEEGLTYAEIALELQRRGVKTRRGHTVWSASQVWRLIDDQ